MHIYRYFQCEYLSPMINPFVSIKFNYPISIKFRYKTLQQHLLVIYKIRNDRRRRSESESVSIGGCSAFPEDSRHRSALSKLQSAEERGKRGNEDT